MNYVSREKFWPLITRYKAELIKRLGGDILGLALFGSVARNKASAQSDIDLLTLIKSRYEGMHEVAINLSVDSRQWQENRDLEREGIRTRIYNIYKTASELAENPLILLDITDHGEILYDSGDSMRKLLDRFRIKLKELGSRKIVFGDGKWAWDLKPDWVPGEIVEITL